MKRVVARGIAGVFLCADVLLYLRDKFEDCGVIVIVKFASTKYSHKHCALSVVDR